jgi:hypothetical protein
MLPSSPLILTTARRSQLVRSTTHAPFARETPENGATMRRQTLEARVERLEARVTKLEELPARMDALSTQISQLREEMHREFSNVGDEIRAGDEGVIRTLREEIRAGDEGVIRTLREEIRAGDEETRRVLRAEMRAIADEIMGQARMLYEDMNAKLKIIQEGQQPRS